MGRLNFTDDLRKFFKVLKKIKGFGYEKKGDGVEKWNEKIIAFISRVM